LNKLLIRILLHLQVEFSVYNTNYLPIKKEQYITSSDKVKEEVFEYDDKFNLICTKTKDYSSTHWLEVRYTYNSNGQLTRKTDPLGLYEDYSYDSNGFRYSVKNHKNHITTYTYDAWGRKIQTAFPDGPQRTVQQNGLLLLPGP
uniref:RHS repeat domain-containing protein n=1 Tax=Bacteroides nordii TaxID=291645 RepID=UPI002A823368